MLGTWSPTGTPGRSALVGDTFTHGEAQQAAVSDRRLYRLRDAGEIVALGGGVYRWADAPPADDDLVEIAERVPAGTPCLETALVRHGLIDAIPTAIDVAVPRGSTRPALRAPVRLHQFDRATFGLGRDLLDVGARHALGIYSAERSIIDVVRLRHRDGSDMAWEALRRWLAKPGRSPAQLIELAGGCHEQNRPSGMHWRSCCDRANPRHYGRPRLPRPAQESAPGLPASR